ncbi:MAG: hypothetical protein EOM50_10425 [Erysipelotrichia bacterium]|nr:hypothetical protein [Erysipelotrichia bacterium]
MKKTIIIPLAIFSTCALFALEVMPNSLIAQQPKTTYEENLGTSDSEQKQITTKADLNQFISVLQAAYKLGDKSKAYLLGGVYAQEHKLQDGIIPPNIPLALQYFTEALNNGYGLSAWNIVIIKYLPENDYFNALEILKKGLSAKYTDQNAKITLALTYGTIVLDKLSENQRAIREARDIIYPYAIGNNLASLDYVLANLLNLNNETDEANKFLNSACNNPQAPASIVNACMGGSEIVTSDSTGKIIQRDLSTCGQQQ